MELLFIITVTVLGLYGFILAAHIHNKKKEKTKLVCPMRSNCETVIHSDYSKIAGIPVEVLGMMYYAFIGGVYGVFFLIGGMPFMILMLLFWFSFCSVLFSVYLVSIQAFVIKQWCAWCLMSAGTSILIFLASYWHLSPI
ncbi:MAG: vitamin K epoxide reductase family protein [Candidatus Pacebacteria bacterium]|nr:vitamin K epoxide reductase family protein [Candidatus Paceibacterota bacterium]